jgi:SWI/SNF-related matrix-associated actin-dependent regulator 1 of chromatin subfamily A
LLGIGPECLGDWGARDIKMENVTITDQAILKALIQDKKVDQWLPKATVKSTEETTGEITVPADHKIFTTKTENAVATKRVAKCMGKTIDISFPYKKELVDMVKTFPGRMYNPRTRVWSCPISVEAIETLKAFDFEMSEELIQRLHLSKVDIKELDSVHIKGLRRELYPFQNIGVSFIESKQGRALIGDEMGLGKTVQALGYLQMHREDVPVIIVCPASLKLSWRYEARRWLSKPINVEVLEGTTPYDTTGDILIINYDILTSWVDYLIRLKPKIMITDECHYYKNNGAGRTKAVKKLAKYTPGLIALSGTPITSRPVEIYNAVSLIDPTIFPNFFSFAKRYCDGKNNGWGWDFSGASNTQELHEKLTSTIMLRRKKKEVLKDLPDKTYAYVPIDLDNEKEYIEAEYNFIKWVRSTKGDDAAEKASNAEQFAQTEALKQISIRGKMKGVKQWVKNFIDSSDEKLVLFATHKAVIDDLMKTFAGVVVKIDGSVPPNKRKGVEEQFQTDTSIRLLVGNIQAAGVGLTLTAASNVAFIEYPWTPGELSQAIDRVHRITQKEAVNVWYLIAEATVDADIAQLLDKKRKVLDSVLDGAETQQQSLISELINLYHKK